MKITRATLLKASPFAALIAGMAGGALAVAPLAGERTQAPPTEQSDARLQLAQAGPTRATPSSRTDMQLSFAPVVARASPAVVNVYAQRVVRSMSRDPFFGRFSAPRIQQSLGSGVIVRSDGVIVVSVTPAGGETVEVSTDIKKGDGENRVADKVRDSLKAALANYRLSLDDGEDVLIKKRSGQPNFDAVVVSNTVESVRIRVQRE